MSFRGELREFELPDILQLIASQQKAGWLKVMTKGRCHFVFFRDGKITSTKNPADENDPLEEYIDRRGLLTPDQADRVAAARRKSGLDVQDVLVKEGLLSDDQVLEIFEAMVEQDIFELMSIKSGTYEFETEDRSDPLPEGALCADIGPILMEGARKADEVSEMRRALGPEDGVLSLTPAGRSAEVSLDDEKAVLALVNGVRPIDAVIEESGLDRYTATRLLFDCARRGWVKRVRSPGGARRADDAVPGEFDARRAVRWAAPVAALLAVSVLFSDALQPLFRDDMLVGEWRARASQLLEARTRERIRLAVEVHRVKTGRYPASLETLVEGGLLAPEEATGAARDRLAYAATADGADYVLAPLPPPDPGAR